MPGHNLEWLATRNAAQQHVCPTCHAPVGGTCSNLATGKPIQGQPAHWQRIHTAQDAGREGTGE